MPDLQISVMAAQPFLMSPSKMTVSDSTSTRTPTFAARVSRMFLATVTGSAGVNTGTEADPDEWIKGALQYQLNNAGLLSNWTCALQPDGRLKITYNGTGTGTITWDGVSGSTSLIPRYLAGFDANVSLGAGASMTGAYQVTHAAFVPSGRANSDGWQVIPKRSAIGETDNGLSYSLTASLVRRVYKADWRFLPRDWAQRTALGANGTPYEPTRALRWTAPSATPYTTGTVAGDLADTTHAVTDPPWSLVDFFSTVHGKRCALAVGNFQALVAATDSAYFTGTFSREMLQAERAARPSAKDTEARYDWTGVEFRLASQATR